MGKVHSFESGMLGPIKVFDAQGTTAEISVTLEQPARRFSVQFSKTSTSATLVVTGHLASSGDSTVGPTLFSFAASTVASVLTSTESTGPLSRLSFNHAAGASSGGITAWLAAGPA